MLLQALAGISLSLFSFLFTGSESNVRQGRSRLQTLQMLPQALAGIYLFLFSLFLFSLFSLPVQKATLGKAGPALKRYKCFCRPSRVFSLSLFSFLFTGSESNVRHGRSRLQTLQMLPQALAGISLFLFSLFLFSLLFTGSESNVRQGRSRRQTLGLSFSFLFSLYRFKKQR